jgi:hypothetical protein
MCGAPTAGAKPKGSKDENDKGGKKTELGKKKGELSPL